MHTYIYTLNIQNRILAYIYNHKEERETFYIFLNIYIYIYIYRINSIIDLFTLRTKTHRAEQDTDNAHEYQVYIKVLIYG